MNRSNFKKSINNLMIFISKFPKDFPMPEANFSEDGEISLEWDLHDKKQVAINIDNQNSYGYTFLVDGKYVAGKSDGNITKDLPEELYNYFERNIKWNIRK